MKPETQYGSKVNAETSSFVADKKTKSTKKKESEGRDDILLNWVENLEDSAEGVQNDLEKLIKDIEDGIDDFEEAVDEYAKKISKWLTKMMNKVKKKFI